MENGGKVTKISAYQFTPKIIKFNDVETYENKKELKKI